MATKSKSYEWRILLLRKKGHPIGTVDAPDTYVRPWTAVVPMRRSDDRMFEAACHEGNYALEGILRGARAQDKMRRTP